MDGQLTKGQPQMDTKKSKNRQQEAESSHPNKQVMLSGPGPAQACFQTWNCKLELAPSPK